MPPKFVRNLSDDDLLNAKEAEKEKLLKDSDEEDFFLRGPSTSTKSLRVNNDNIKHVQFQVDEVSSIMKENIGKIIDRGDRLQDLEDKSDLLSSNADEFRNSSRRIRRKMWWQNMKLKLVIGGTVIIIIVIIIIIIVRSQ